MFYNSTEVMGASGCN